MGALFPDLVRPPAPRKPRRVLAHPVDRGESDTYPSPEERAAKKHFFAHFQCSRCGWDAGWRHCTREEERGGIPCEVCNGAKT